MRDESQRRRFEDIVLPHQASAYNLARWLSRSDADAADIVQEAFLRALRFFDGYRGGDPQSWLLSIVRNTAHTWLQTQRPALPMDRHAGDEQFSCGEPWAAGEQSSPDPMTAVVEQQDARRLRQAIAQLPLEQREILILRELDGLSYRQIATVVGCPIGTVMSRLYRARDGLASKFRSEGAGTP